MNRRIALATIAALFFVIPSCQKADARVNKANFDKINIDMARTEVEAMLGDKYELNPELGLAEGSSAAGAVGIGDPTSLSHSGPKQDWVKWGTNKTYILVCFDRGGKVRQKDSKGLK